MKKSEFRGLSDKLNNHEDIERLAIETGLDRELLLVLYTQKTVRTAWSSLAMERRTSCLLKSVKIGTQSSSSNTHSTLSQKEQANTVADSA